MAHEPSAPVATDAPLTRVVRNDTGPIYTVLVVDDEAPVRDFLQQVLTAAGFAVDAAVDGPSALEAISARPPDVVLLDVHLPGTNGFDVCRRLRLDRATRLTPIILVTGWTDRATRVEGLDAGADDFLTKPVDTLEMLARVRSLARMKQFTDSLDTATDILLTLACMIEARDGYGEGHCHRMANYATALGRATRVSEADNLALYRGAFVHDIGMLSVPEAILRKDGPLSAEEREHVKSHPVIGEGFCDPLRSLRPARPIVRWHHEHLDGSGYPDGLAGDAIPIAAQIVGIVDVYEAVTSHRSYQRRHSPEEAIAILREQVARGWRRADLVEAFASIIQTRSSSDGEASA
ncbi:MAG TPA: HD domain-containing phosphohydrolase [Vicinamibacterales bacterium]|nr:HD domain-containing phosphohydrolase [Vicinamibacterales bacterium]